jgi:hypothetical protein
VWQRSAAIGRGSKAERVHALPPMYYQSQTLFKGIRFKKSETVLCDVRSKWMDFSFTLMNSPEGIVSSRLFHAKAEVIYYSEFESNDYLNLQEQASQCLEKQSAIPIEYISASKP